MTAKEIRAQMDLRQYEMSYWNRQHTCGKSGESKRTSYPQCTACDKQQRIQNRISKLQLEATLLGK